MANISPTDMGKIADGARLANGLPYMLEEIAGMERRVIGKMVGAVDSGELTPDLAVALVHELHSYRKLAKRLEQKVAIGTSLGERHSEDLQR